MKIGNLQTQSPWNPARLSPPQYNSARQPTKVGRKPYFAPRNLAYRGADRSQLIQDGTFSIQHNKLGIGARGSTYYARAVDGTLTSERPTGGPASYRNYLYDGKGSVIGLIDSAGTVQTDYKYDRYGHPENATSLLDTNPFGYRGAYAAGLETDGTVCSGPNGGGGDGDGFYDPEDGRATTATSDFELMSQVSCTPSTEKRVANGIVGAFTGVGSALLAWHGAEVFGACVAQSEGALILACIDILGKVEGVAAAGLIASGDRLGEAFSGGDCQPDGGPVDTSPCGNLGVACLA